MKYGYRKPNINSRIKARTTGRVKRSVKRAVNPLYGKKGMGLAANPKKSIYNRVYSRTTVDAFSHHSSSPSFSSSDFSSFGQSGRSSDPKEKRKTGRVMIFFGILCVIGFCGSFLPGFIVCAALLFFFGVRRHKAFKSSLNENGKPE